jgi:hypothetical protein
MADDRCLDPVPPRLAAAIERLYDVFGTYQLGHPDNSPLNPPIPDELSTVPLRRLEGEALWWASSKVVTTFGDGDTLRWLLPRAFEVLSTYVRSADVDPVFLLPKLDRAGWRTWPTEEQAAVEEYFGAWIEAWTLDDGRLFPLAPHAVEALREHVVGADADDLLTRTFRPAPHLAVERGCLSPVGTYVEARLRFEPSNGDPSETRAIAAEHQVWAREDLDPCYRSAEDISALSDGPELPVRGGIATLPDGVRLACETYTCQAESALELVIGVPHAALSLLFGPAEVWGAGDPNTSTWGPTVSRWLADVARELAETHLWQAATVDGRDIGPAPL